ncbi:NAD(P)/FAD-dependent oxidoreductase [Sphingomonas sp. PB2P19]|uniref:flavin-containing monooxygenase n=1 Tax=Sphingomonas rhamnosi TaxID=3096156 RepID=UPI002FC5E401
MSRRAARVEHVDVIVVGAGISGVAAAYHLQTRCPDRSYAILEGRAAMGGTWDLFRYPGVRSDSDMHTLGFAFHPWTKPNAIADGAAIKAYVEAAAHAHGIDRKIRFGHQVTAAAWSTDDARWTVSATGPDGATVTMTCTFLSMCAGYYDYASGYTPEFPGVADFAGRIVHPQFWPDDLDVSGKQVVIIGSGATAMTLVPALARTAAHVTMVQRSPTYVVARPAEDRIANWLAARLSASAAYRLTRWKNVLSGIALYRLARSRPRMVSKRIIAMVREQLGPDYDVETHFTPQYDPWDQRICLVPDGDLFDSIRAGRASVVTDRIERFTRGGLALASGAALAADIVVTATGLSVQLLGGIRLSLDGQPIVLSGRLQYKGMMFDGVPNLSTAFGYTNASWTLKAELTAIHVCRLLTIMRKRTLRQATPRNDDSAMRTEPLIRFTSGYVQRAKALLPVQGARKPWRTNQNYALDVMDLRLGRVPAAMRFSNPEPVRNSGSRSGRLNLSHH